MNKRQTTNALEIIRKRYYEGRPERQTALRKEQEALRKQTADPYYEGPSHVRDIERLYRGLGDESRLKIIYMLNELGEACVREIRQVLKIPQTTLSRHLALLRRMGLVDYHRRGKWRYYYVVRKQPDIVKNSLNCLTRLDSCRKIFNQEMTPQLGKLMALPKARR